jgi:hypothetical protein
VAHFALARAFLAGEKSSPEVFMTILHEAIRIQPRRQKNPQFRNRETILI